MNHLTPDEFVDAVEGTLSASRLEHVEGCDACRRELSALARVWHDAEEEPVPEPSPLFWNQFSARVREAIRVEDAARPEPWWFGWRRASALVPLGALAALVLAIVATIPRAAVAPTPEIDAPAMSATELPSQDAVGADEEWHALAEMVGPLDWDAAGEAGLTVAPGDTERAMLDLSDDERRELSRLIAGELARAKS